MRQGSPAHLNPVEPYQWIAHYQNGTQVAQITPPVVRTTRDLPNVGHITRLEVRGPGGPLILTCPWPEGPTGLWVRARRQLRIGATITDHTVAWQFGFQRGDVVVGVEIAGGRVRRL